MRFPYLTTTITSAVTDAQAKTQAYDRNYHDTDMFHCHILEHEDAGMMGQFSVVTA